jgi:hypothetical protein
MTDAPRRTFDKYINGIREKNDWLKSKKKNPFMIVVFIDDNVYNDKECMRELNKMEKVVLIHFDAPKYKIGKYHIGHFGMLTRYFPMINFNNNPHSVVVTLEADVNDFRKEEDDEMSYDIIERKKFFKENNLAKDYLKINEKNERLVFIEYMLENYKNMKGYYINGLTSRIKDYKVKLILGKVNLDWKIGYCTSIFYEKLKKKNFIDFMNCIEDTKSIKFNSRDMKKYEYAIDEYYLYNFSLRNQKFIITNIFCVNLYFYTTEFERDLLSCDKFEKIIQKVEGKKWKGRDYIEYIDKNIYISGINKIILKNKRIFVEDVDRDIMKKYFRVIKETSKYIENEEFKRLVDGDFLLESFEPFVMVDVKCKMDYNHDYDGKGLYTGNLNVMEINY